MSAIQPDGSTYRTITKADLGVVARTFGRAFADDPMWLWVMEGRSRMVEHTGRLFAAMAKHHMQKNNTVLMTRSGEAAAVWAPPGGSHISYRDTVPMLPTMIRSLGYSGLKKSAALTSLEKLHPSEPHWYLMILGTDPAHQRRGHGRTVVEPMLERADDEGVLSYLESSKESNVPYYRQFGFEVTREHRLAGGGPPIWLMERPPQSRSPQP